MKQITVQAVIHAPLEKVWEYWVTPAHIMKWNAASPDWHTPRAENDLCVGGRFSARMEAKDGSFGFDFGGVYSEIKSHELIAYTMDDKRTVKVTFTKIEGKTKVVETFDAEKENSLEMQRAGWQAILDNFNRHTESNKD